MPSVRATFGVAVLAGAALVLGISAMDKFHRRAADAREISGGVWVTEQITPRQVAQYKARGFHAVVDLRPDGEDVGQPSSAEVGHAAQRQGLSFAYVPVPHGAIPDTAVDSLAEALTHAERPVLLYCRSGRRAARTWALAEASRPGGLEAVAIEAAVSSAGQAADDLHELIAARIAARSTPLRSEP